VSPTYDVSALGPPRRFATAAPWLAAAVLAVLTPAARGETINCTAIASAPATISAPGIYCLTGDLNTNLASGSAINITANSVVLDLNGQTETIGSLAGSGRVVDNFGSIVTGQANSNTTFSGKLDHIGDLTKVERERLERGETGPAPEPGHGETSGHEPAAEGAPKHD